MNGSFENESSERMIRAQIMKQSHHDIMARYEQEMQRLKSLPLLKQRDKKRLLDLHDPHTLVMKLCRRELEHRGLPIPHVSP